MKNGTKILIVDDESGMRDLLSRELSSLGYQSATAVDGRDALEKIKREKFQLVISDITMPRMGGLELLAAVKNTDPDIEFLMTTGHGTIESAVDAMKKGAYDFVQKPYELGEILALIEKALERTELKAMLGVYDAGKAIFSTIKLDELLPIMAGLSVQIFKADDVSIMLMDQAGRLSVAAAAGLEGDERKKARLLLGERVAGKVAQDKEPALINGPLDKDPRFSDVDSLRDICSAIVFPLVLEGRILGVLNANRTVRRDPFTVSDMRHAAVLCAQITQAIHNATLYRELADKMREIQEMQTELIQSEKLSALGGLVAGVAHELNQPLNAVKIIIQSILRDVAKHRFEPENFTGDLGEVIKQLDRIGEIINHMRTFTRKQIGETKQEVDVNAAVENAFKFIGEQLKVRNIALAKELAPDLPKPSGDPIKLEQVFLNLLTNARDALEESKSRDKKIVVRSFCRSENGGYAVVSVSDNAGGVPAGLRGKIFEPFFTTKPAGKGTGLGLSISRKIVEEFGGKLELAVEEGVGSAFSVILPVGTPKPSA